MTDVAMRCPYCSFDGEGRCGILDSRTSQGGTMVRRRRKCPSCNQRFTTYEVVCNNGLPVAAADPSVDMARKISSLREDERMMVGQLIGRLAR